MDRADQLNIFKAQTQNVKKLESAKKQLKRSINRAISVADESAEESHTLLLALLYCAWLEALFSKLIHTPYGYSIDEIAQIKGVQATQGIAAAWRKCVELGLRRTSGRASGHTANVRQRLETLVADYVEEPSVLRNKIAHGQWTIALNRDQTRVNAEQTDAIERLDAIDVERRWIVAARLARGAYRVARPNVPPRLLAAG